MWTIAELCTHLVDPVVTGAINHAVQRVIGDSRLAAPEDLFVAVRGTAIDGHAMITEAVRRGATAVVGDRPIHDVDIPLGTPYIQVSNSRRAHAALLRATRADVREALQALTFIGVTGTNGKTTVATVLEHALQARGESVGFFGTTGYRFAGAERVATHTTPDVDQLYHLIVEAHQRGVQTIVMEVSSHALDQDRVDGIDFKAAIFTNLTRDHLDYHETMEAYAAAKQKLFSSLDASAVAVLYGDDSWAPFMKRNCAAHTIVTVGRDPGAMERITHEELDLQGARYRVAGMDVHVPMLGSFNVVNTALCAVVLRQLGWPAEDVVRALSGVHGPVGRMQQLALPGGSMAVVDYAHTADALQQALRTLQPYAHAGGGRLHVVFGCGGDRDTGKRPEMGLIAAQQADVVWITSDNPRTERPEAIIADILGGIPEQIASSERVHVVPDRAEAIQQAVQQASEQPGCVVLVAGKGHEQFQVIGTEKIPFSDQQVIASCQSASRASS